MSEAPMGALHDSTNTNGSQGELADDVAAMNGGDKDGHGTGGEGASTQAARKGKKDGKRKQPAELPKSPEDNGKAKVKRSRELASLEVKAPPPVSGAANRPSRTALSKEEQDKAEKASRSARAYAPLPYQLKRLFFRSDPGDVKIAGRTLQLVHKHPHIYQIEDFLTEGEYDYMEELIDQQYGRFRASYTDQDVDTKVVDSYRTSSFIALRKGGDKAVRQIEMRAAEILGMSTENVEPLQMVGYRQHDKFDLHHDMGTYDDKTRQVEAVSPRRLATFFLYLNNLPEGEGHTVFPSLKVNGRPLSSQPQRLKALLWCNVLENGEPDARLIHRADPCREEGSMKFGINVWVTDKNLQALALSTSGATLNPAKRTNKRSILSMLDEPCEICGGRRDPEKILLCDHCDLGYHMHCLDPPLKKIPTTAWMCPECEGRKPRKGEYCEECEGGLNEHRMVLCDTCDRAWHTYCLEPKLPRVPKDDWHCARCVRKREGLPAIRVSKKKKSEEEKALMADPDYPGCSGCGKKDQLDKMLLCDSYKDRGCKAEWHMHCLTPPLKAVPQDDWFCPSCAAVKAEDDEATRREEARLKPHDYILLPPPTPDTPAQLACITQVSEDEQRVSVRVAERSTQAIRQGVKFSLPSAKDPPRDVAADTVLGKVRVELRGPWVFVDTTAQPLARHHLLPTPTHT